MSEKSVFISSCTRRQLARRRPTRGNWRYGTSPALVAIAMGMAGYIAARGGL